ncbi:MAG: serine/threonine-protein kinase PknK, partial [Deltaproteobacteria bacterium]
GTVMAMVQSRLERLSADARRTLRAASVFGEVFWASAVHVLLGQTARTVTVQSAFAELTDGELIVPRGIGRFADQPEYRFRHSLLREAAYAMLTEADRALGHRLAAEWLEGAGENDAAVIAEHFERAGEPLRAAAWFDRAAAQALGANDFRAAAVQADRGLASGATGALRASLVLQKAEAHGHLAESDAALEAALEALELMPKFGTGWLDALRIVSRTAVGLGRFELPAEISHEFVERLDAGARDAPFLRAANDTAFALMYGGDAARAFAILDRVGAIDLATQRDPACEASVHLAKATLAMRDGDVGALLVHEQAAFAALERSGDTRAACGEAVNVSYAQLELGMYPQAELSLRVALASAERLGLPRPLALAQQNLGAALFRQGQYEEGERMLRACIEAFDPHDERRLIGGGYTYLAQLQTLRGDFTEAKANARRATELMAEARGCLPQAVATLARALRLEGEVAGALVEATRAIELLREVGTVDEGESLVRLEYAESLRAAGRETDARDALQEARDALLARVARFRDERHRAVFLTSVPDNARTLALCRDATGG